ncbi:BamA/OMP85 family outer membrane protein [Rufibacter quisquiliarum]|uniref:Outer membrane protein assembly factor BamA n=1 Tax=Rufibacter quisquiliarum TaxID=1549639 RepID=A0A839GCH7_9BACT|nr:BamA/TamA family outer membrane protein [Rufibacter quisquiliarum]MBA9076060.1 outer membrane protein assembly factor BamA [Rufibacter quisquiliarum]
MILLLSSRLRQKFLRQRYTIVLLLWGLLWLSGWAQAQDKRAVQVVSPDPAQAKVWRRYQPKTLPQDSLGRLQELQNWLLRVQEDGYLTASVDSTVRRNDSLWVHVHAGRPYHWAYLRNGNVGEGLLERVGFREKLYNGSPFKPAEFAKLQQALLREAENAGYPFAAVKLDSLRLYNDSLQGVLRVEKGPLILIDSVQMVGTSRLQQRALYRYTQLFPGQPYSQQRIEAAMRALRQLPFVRVAGEPQVAFAQNKARLYFLLDEKKANQFDGIIGFLPDPNSNENKLLITGEVNLQVRNLRGSGKQIGLHWRKVDQNSQLLDVEYRHPHIFSTPFEVATLFHLYKQDTSFLNLRPRVEIAYPLSTTSRLTFFAEVLSSQLLSPTALRQRRSDSTAIDANFTSYGLSYSWNSLDDLFFPRRGMQAFFQGAVGTKRVQRNARVEASYYDTLQMRSTQLSVAGRVERYWPMSKNGVVLTRLKSEALVNQRLYLNELFRLGGLASIRGFDDYSFYASSYAISTLEYRLYTGEESYVFLLYDQGYLRRDLAQEKNYQWASGVGGGISFSTGAGVFQLVYSVGRTAQEGFSLQRGKIHFGITGRF